MNRLDIEKLEVTFEGTNDFVATESETKPVKVIIECPQGLESGTDVRVVISTFHSFTRDWKFDGAIVNNGKGVVVLGHGLPVGWDEMIRGGVGPAGGGLIGRPISELYLCTVQVARSLSPGSRLVFPFHANGSPHANVKGSLQVKVRLPGSYDFTSVGSAMPLHNHPGELTRLEARITAAPDESGKHRLIVFATDEHLNPIPNFQGEVAVKSDSNLRGLPKIIPIGNRGCGVVEGIAVDSRNPIRVKVFESNRGLEATTGPVVDSLQTERKHFFGAMHFHTQLSVDGDRDPRAAYAYARDYLNLDVIAMTDHAPIGPGWDECLAVNAEFHESGHFVTIPAWESSNAYGHANLYLRTPDSEGGTWLWNPDVCPSEVTFPDDVVMVPHHSNCGQMIKRGTHREVLSKGIFWTKYDWSISNPRARLVEIVQGRSNFEADALDKYWGIHMGGQGASVQDALALGWRLGFVAGTDNHEGYPTQRAGVYVGMTCYRAPELTRDAIWQALDQRWTYATSGVPIVCEFFVNKIRSGAEGILAPGGTVTFSAHLHGTAPIERVEIISMGKIVWQTQPNTWDVKLDTERLPAPNGNWAYYYLRLHQKDGHRAWLSPVWLDRHQASP